MFGPQLLNYTLTAAVATGQYLFVLNSGSNYGGPAVSGVQFNPGISQNSAAIGEGISVCPLGLSRCVVNSAVTAGALLTATAGGGATVAASGDMVSAYALESGAVADIIPVFVVPPWKLG
jgi:hypothetical protein